jgi:methionyl-tRNA formyltransferase
LVASRLDGQSAGVKLVVAATAPFGASVLEKLAERFEIELLLTRPDRPRGRGRAVGSPPAKLAAELLGIPVVQPERLDAAPGTAPTVVVCAYGLFIPPALLEQRLWLNVHPSLLPRWRGAAPVERAIMAGDRETGVTIHRTTAELDAGPIAAQRAFPIEPEDDAGAVYERAAPVAVELLSEALPEPSFTPQSGEGATYAEKIVASDRELDWSRPLEEILNRVRALSPHIGARGVVAGRVLTVWRAAPGGPDSLLVEDGVELLEVQPEGKRRMTAAEYLRGLRV